MTTHEAERTAATPLTDTPRQATASGVAQTPPFTVTLEGIAYAALGLAVLLMLVLGLGEIPLTVNEVPRALASWQAMQRVAEPTALTDSALVQLAHIAAMSTLGSHEATVRLPTALAGWLLVFSPLLFRGLFGPARTFALVTVLAFSPVILAAARLDSPVIWEALLAVLALWAVWRYTVTWSLAWGVATTVLFLALALLAGPTGHVLALVLLASFFVAERFQPVLDEDDGANDTPPTVAATLRGWPWLLGLGLGALVVVVVSTLFMIYPVGLNAVGQALGTGLAGWVRPTPFAPPLFVLLASLLYEPILWIFGVAAMVVRVGRRDRPDTADQVLAAWVGLAAVASVFYVGGGAANALWLTLPLAALTAGLVVDLLADEDGMLWYNDAGEPANLFGITVPGWSRWAVAALTAGLVLLALMHVGVLARALQVTPLVGNWNGALQQLAPSALILLMLILLLVFSGFTAASIWGGRATVRGGALGLLAVGLVAMLGSGWQVTHNRADDPRELWHTSAHSDDVFVLRETLVELAEREVSGFNALPVVVVTDDVMITDDGIVAWTLRDFPNTRFVRHIGDATAQEVVITSRLVDEPDLGGNYLGQTFTLRLNWNLGLVTVREFGAWWFQRETIVPTEIHAAAVLWLRQDVYAGVDVPGLR